LLCEIEMQHEAEIDENGERHIRFKSIGSVHDRSLRGCPLSGRSSKKRQHARLLWCLSISVRMRLRRVESGESWTQRIWEGSLFIPFSIRYGHGIAFAPDGRAVPSLVELREEAEQSAAGRDEQLRTAHAAAIAQRIAELHGRQEAEARVHKSHEKLRRTREVKTAQLQEQLLRSREARQAAAEERERTSEEMWHSSEPIKCIAEGERISELVA
jgi:hypothetical protein